MTLLILFSCLFTFKTLSCTAAAVRVVKLCFVLCFSFLFYFILERASPGPPAPRQPPLRWKGMALEMILAGFLSLKLRSRHFIARWNELVMRVSSLVSSPAVPGLGGWWPRWRGWPAAGAPRLAPRRQARLLPNLQAQEAQTQGQGLQEGRRRPQRQERHRGLQSEGKRSQKNHEVEHYECLAEINVYSEIALKFVTYFCFIFSRHRFLGFR